MAEGEGFEPPVRFPVQRFSRPPVSTAHTSLRVSCINSLPAFWQRSCGDFYGSMAHLNFLPVEPAGCPISPFVARWDSLSSADHETRTWNACGCVGADQANRCSPTVNREGRAPLAAPLLRFQRMERTQADREALPFVSIFDQRSQTVGE